MRESLADLKAANASIRDVRPVRAAAVEHRLAAATDVLALVARLPRTRALG